MQEEFTATATNKSYAFVPVLNLPDITSKSSQVGESKNSHDFLAQHAHMSGRGGGLDATSCYDSFSQSQTGTALSTWLL